ncbi:single-stranded DNA-binding protein [Acinetobacter sp.]|uniref:single-stranded DNA-binding protein n=1 Tax=Acinetobacter sp. TaxID=472 RepID=UPI003D05AC32
MSIKSFQMVIVEGNVGKDPEVRTFDSSEVMNLTVAVNDNYKGKDGNWVERTEWFSVVKWRPAEFHKTRIAKGTPVRITGKMQTRSWDGKDGSKQYKTELIADNLEVMETKANGSHEAEDSEPVATAASAPAARPASDNLPF